MKKFTTEKIEDVKRDFIIVTTVENDNEDEITFSNETMQNYVNQYVENGLTPVIMGHKSQSKALVTSFEHLSKRFH